MNNDERRSHRLHSLLQYYCRHPREAELYRRAKMMGISDSTARDYVRTVIARARMSAQKRA